MKVILIIPAFNEEKNIERVVENLKLNLPQCDYVVVNDCSSDKTRKVCTQNNYNFISSTSKGIYSARCWPSPSY